MHILLTSHVFYPAMGGIEVMSQLLAESFVKEGHKVTVVTNTKNDQADNFPFEVVRQPNLFQFLSLTSKCDVFFQNNISLSLILPVLVLRKPLVIAVRTWIRRNDGSMSWQDHLKKKLLNYATCISISDAVATHIEAASVVIGNPYRDDLFALSPNIPREKDLIYVGRLVSDKGVDILLRAVANLKKNGLSPVLTIIGDGPEQENLKNLSQTLGIAPQITFAGRIDGSALTPLMNAHKIMVVPSRWDEPFGIVALEGIACGCVVVGSEGGGLKDAIGPCGVTFPNGDVKKLTQVLNDLLTDGDKITQILTTSDEHLQKHTQKYVTERYLEVLFKSLG